MLTWIDCGDYRLGINEGLLGLEVLSCSAGAVDVVIPGEFRGRPIVSIGREAFKNTHTLESVVIPEGVRWICQSAFARCENLKRITIPVGLIGIEAMAFSGCASLRELVLPYTIKNLDPSLKDGCASLRALSVAGGCEDYYSEGNCIIRRNGTLVLGCPGSVVPRGVKVIGHSAFSSLPLGEMELPGSVEEIEPYAFSWSTLEYIYIPDSVKKIGNAAFLGCSRMEEITIPRDVDVISDSCFSDCTALADIAFSRAVKTIERAAFCGCHAIEVVNYEGSSSEYISIKIGPSNEALTGKLVYDVDDIYDDLDSDETDYGGKTESDFSVRDLIFELRDDNAVVVGCAENVVDVVIPAYHNGLPVVTVMPGAFRGRKSLETVVVGPNVDWINYGAFCMCTSLRSVTLPDGLTSISNGAFSGCTSLKSIEIPDSVYSISNNAFEGCTSLTDVTLPDNDYFTLGNRAFSGCTALEEIAIPNSITDISMELFCGCSSLRRVDLPLHIQSIGAKAFYDCRALEYIDLPVSIKTINEGAFYNCQLLSRVRFGSGIEEIASRAFMGCTALEEIVIPDNVKYIGIEAFRDCKALRRLAVGKGVKTIRELAFANCLMLEEVEYSATAINQYNLADAVFTRAGRDSGGVAIHITAGVEKLPLCLLSEYMVPSQKAPTLPNIKSIELDEEECEDKLRALMVSRLCGVIEYGSCIAVDRVRRTIKAIGVGGLC